MPTSTLARPNIVLADYDDKELEVVRARLLKFRPQWLIHCMTEGEKVMQFARNNRVDCVISEIKLQDMSGFDLLCRLQTLYPDIVRITLSADLKHEVVLENARANHRFINRAIADEELISAIECSLRLSRMLSEEKLVERIGDIHTLPALPEIYQQMVAELTSTHSSLVNVARIIESDTGLTATVLKIVNSAFYGLNQRVESVSQGVALLGVHLIKNITLTAKVFAQFEASEMDLAKLRKLNDTANKTGALCNQFARLARVPRTVVDHVQIAGMLSIVGQLIALNRRITECPDQETVAPEVIGAYLLRLWLLPDPVLEAVAWQHEKPPRHTASITPLVILHSIQYLGHELADISNNQQRKSCKDYLDTIVPAEIAERWIEAYSDLQRLTAHSDLNESKAA